MTPIESTSHANVADHEPGGRSRTPVGLNLVDSRRGTCRFSRPQAPVDDEQVVDGRDAARIEVIRGNAAVAGAAAATADLVGPRVFDADARAQPGAPGGCACGRREV